MMTREDPRKTTRKHSKGKLVVWFARSKNCLAALAFRFQQPYSESASLFVLDTLTESKSSVVTAATSKKVVAVVVPVVEDVTVVVAPFFTRANT